MCVFIVWGVVTQSLYFPCVNFLDKDWEESTFGQVVSVVCL